MNCFKNCHKSTTLATLASMRAFSKSPSVVKSKLAAIESPIFPGSAANDAASLALALPCGSMHERAVHERGLSSILKALNFKVLVLYF